MRVSLVGAQLVAHPDAARSLEYALGLLQAVALSRAPWPRAPGSPWGDLADGVRALAIAACLTVPPRAAPHDSDALAAVRAAVAAVDELLVEAAADSMRGAILRAAWELVREAAGRLEPVVLVDATRVEGSA